MGLLKKILQAVIAFTTVIGSSDYGANAHASETNEPAIVWAFTRAKQHPETLLINTINSTVSTLDVAIYSLSYPDIVDALKKAKLRGVEVRIIADKHQSALKSQEEALKLLGSARIPIKVNTHSGLMHLKVTIADQKIVTTGSFNFSKAASTVNDEVLLVIRSVEAAQSFTAEFESMWNNAQKYETVALNIAYRA